MEFIGTPLDLERYVAARLKRMDWPRPERHHKIARQAAATLSCSCAKPGYATNWAPFFAQVEWTVLIEMAERELRFATPEEIAAAARAEAEAAANINGPGLNFAPKVGPFVFDNRDQFVAFVAGQMDSVGWPGSDATVRESVASQVMRRGFQITDQAIETAIQTRMTRSADLQATLDAINAPYWGGDWEAFLRPIKWVDEILSVA